MRKLTTLALVALLSTTQITSNCQAYDNSVATKIASSSPIYPEAEIGSHTYIEMVNNTKIYRVCKKNHSFDYEYINSDEHCDDVKEDYIVVDGAKYSVDGTKLLAIPTDVTSFTVKEGTKIINISAILKHGNIYYRDYDRDSVGCHVILKELILPKSLKSIDFEAEYEYGLEEFFDCHNVVDIKKVTIQNKNLSSEELSNLFRYFYKLKAKNLKAPKGVVTRKNDMLIYKKSVIKYYGKGGKVTIPNGIKSIQKYAFSTASVKESDWKPFSYKGAKITEITIPKTVKSIKEGAFRGCSKLKKVNFKGTTKLTSIGDYAFRNTKINTFPYMKNLKSIGKSAFTGTKLRTITLPYDTQFNRDAFGNGTPLTINIKGR